MGFRLFELAAADLNYDLRVDAADFALIIGAFGETTSRADLTGDGVVNGADVLAWQRQVGGVPPSRVPSSAVPEPAAMLLALFAFSAVRRRRQTAAES
jgi:MYXO-CTERM domain-containing protein